ncbi:translation initiation factor IF-2-like [Vidua macroura]|uniref:translation initiation factor IF-2-like n=1 Tax=Vidua macroura TaxID=187451 RepID=UPI0023A8C459|nr:translation initiation factor IF-2-like [Vidua macroura]
MGGEAAAGAIRERRFRRPLGDPPRGRCRRGRGQGRGRGGTDCGGELTAGPAARRQPVPACRSSPPCLGPPLLTRVPAPSSTSELPGPLPAPALRARPAPVAPPGPRPLPPLTLCSVPRGAGRSRPHHVTRGAPGTAAPGRPEGPRLPAPRRGCGPAGAPDGLAWCRAQSQMGPARNKPQECIGLMDQPRGSWSSEWALRAAWFLQPILKLQDSSHWRSTIGHSNWPDTGSDLGHHN